VKEFITGGFAEGIHDAILYLLINPRIPKEGQLFKTTREESRRIMNTLFALEFRNDLWIFSRMMYAVYQSIRAISVLIGTKDITEKIGLALAKRIDTRNTHSYDNHPREPMCKIP